MVSSEGYPKIILTLVFFVLFSAQTGMAKIVCPKGKTTFECIQERGKVVAGVKYDAKLFGYGNNSKNVKGFDIDLVKALAKKWLGDENAVEFIRVTSHDRIKMLQNREIHLIAATMTNTSERDQDIDFSQTYFLDGQRLLVNIKSGVGKNIGANEEFSLFAKQLENKIIAAVKGSTSIVNIEEKANEFNVRLKKIEPFRNYEKAVQALKQGKVDFVTTDGGILFGFAQKYPDLQVVGAPFSNEPYGIGIYQGDTTFQEKVNKTLQELWTTGIYKKIFRKWFPDKKLFTLYPIEITSHICSKNKSSVDCIQNRGKIIAGVKYDAKLFGYRSKNDNVAGFDIDIIRAFAKCWLGDGEAVDFIRVTSKDRIRMLQERKIDLVAATMTHTKEREEFIDFSKTYFLDGQRLLVNTTSDVGKNIRADESFKSFKDKLNGKVVAAIKGSTSIKNIRKNAREFGIIPTFKLFRTYDKAVEALQAKQVDYLTTDGGILSGFAKDDPKLKVVGAPFSNEPYGIGVYKGDADFQKLINITLQTLMATGEYEKIYKKWFPDWSLYEIEVFPGKSVFSPFECSWLVDVEKRNSKSPVGCPNGMKPIETRSSKFCLDSFEVSNKNYHKDNDKPVIKVNWNEANDYCKSVGKRLPTMEELKAALESQPKGMKGLAKDIREWVSDDDGKGRKLYYPYGDMDAPLFPDDSDFPYDYEISFRCVTPFN
ncbi:MAG: transporter substrate-binding domain-containing protein [Desulfobacterales bacterium]|nr:transporter substrate-binding domain-containing protein [Desulfobacterales bacterium]